MIKLFAERTYELVEQTKVQKWNLIFIYDRDSISNYHIAQ